MFGSGYRSVPHWPFLNFLRQLPQLSLGYISIPVLHVHYPKLLELMVHYAAYWTHQPPRTTAQVQDDGNEANEMEEEAGSVSSEDSGGSDTVGGDFDPEVTL